MRWAPGAEVASWHVQADTPARLGELADDLGLAGALAARRKAQRRPRRRRWQPFRRR